MLKTVTAVLYARLDIDESEGLLYGVTDKSFWLNDDDIVLDEEAEVQVTIPDELDKGMLLAKGIETLREKQRKTRIQSEEKCAELQQKIENLLLLEHNPME